MVTGFRRTKAQTQGTRFPPSAIFILSPEFFKGQEGPPGPQLALWASVTCPLSPGPGEAPCRPEPQEFLVTVYTFDLSPEGDLQLRFKDHLSLKVS